jgi:hypothetical protein
MNIIGRILVILNLAMAFVVVGFIAVVFNTRTNWQKYTEGFKNEMRLSGRQAQVLENNARELEAKLKDALVKLETAQRNARAAQDVMEAKLKDEKARAEDDLIKAKESDLTAQKALGEVQRLTEQAKDLNKVIEDRQKKIVDMEKTAKDLREFALAKEKESQDDRARNETLKAALLEKERLIAKLQAGPKGIQASTPPANVRGIIEKVDAKDGLVQISLGSDQGLKKNHILQVQRTKPRAEYLGQIRLLDVDFHKSIGRWIAPRPEGKRLQPGDQVVSSLDR